MARDAGVMITRQMAQVVDPVVDDRGLVLGRDVVAGTQMLLPSTSRFGASPYPSRIPNGPGGCIPAACRAVCCGRSVHRRREARRRHCDSGSRRRHRRRVRRTRRFASSTPLRVGRIDHDRPRDVEAVEHGVRPGDVNGVQSVGPLPARPGSQLGRNRGERRRRRRACVRRVGIAACARHRLATPRHWDVGIRCRRHRRRAPTVERPVPTPLRARRSCCPRTTRIAGRRSRPRRATWLLPRRPSRPGSGTRRDGGGASSPNRVYAGAVGEALRTF